MRAPPSIPNYLPEVLLLNTIALGVRISTCEFGGGHKYSVRCNHLREIDRANIIVKLDVTFCVQMDFYLGVIDLENVRGISQLGAITYAKSHTSSCRNISCCGANLSQG